MKKILRRNLEFLHGCCDPVWINAAIGSLESTIDLVISDTTLRLPQIDTGTGFLRELAAAVETDAALLANVLYRISRGIFLGNPKHPALPVLAHLMRFRSCMEIYYSTEIGPRFRVEHGMGTVIGPRNKIGSDFTVHQGVTLGQRRLFSGQEFITIGNNCQVFSGAAVLGMICIGDNVKIGANAVLLTDAEANSTYLGIPAKRI